MNDPQTGTPLLEDPISRYRRMLMGGQPLPLPQGPPPVNPDGTPAPVMQAPPDAAQSAMGAAGIPDAQGSQWSGSGGWQGPSMAKGQLVTQPTIARLGEHGPEAVVPLTPRTGNHLQPDLLEGHMAEPKPQGVTMSRYKRFTNRAL